MTYTGFLRSVLWTKITVVSGSQINNSIKIIPLGQSFNKVNGITELTELMELTKLLELTKLTELSKLTVAPLFLIVFMLFITGEGFSLTVTRIGCINLF